MNETTLTTTDFDVTDTRVVLIDADPETVLGAAERLELARPVLQAIDALGLADRIALEPTRLESGRACEQLYGMAWRVDGAAAESVVPHELMVFDRPGYVKVIWDLRIEAGGDSGTLLSTTTRMGATDPATRERLAGACGILGPLSSALSKRALTAVKRHAENGHDRPSLATVEIAPTRGQSSILAVAA